MMVGFLGCASGLRSPYNQFDVPFLSFQDIRCYEVLIFTCVFHSTCHFCAEAFFLDITGLDWIQREIERNAHANCRLWNAWIRWRNFHCDVRHLTWDLEILFEQSYGRRRVSSHRVVRPLGIYQTLPPLACHCRFIYCSNRYPCWNIPLSTMSSATVHSPQINISAVHSTNESLTSNLRTFGAQHTDGKPDVFRVSHNWADHSRRAAARDVMEFGLMWFGNPHIDGVYYLHFYYLTDV